MIALEDVSFAYGQKPVLQAVSLRFPKSGAVCLFGASGCGKTTLLRLLSGLEKPDKGRLTGLEGKRTAMLFQEDRLLPWLSVLENVAVVLEGPDARARAADWLELVGLADAAHKRPAALSGGMRRRAALARALAVQPTCCCWMNRSAGWTRQAGGSWPDTSRRAMRTAWWCWSPISGRKRSSWGRRCWSCRPAPLTRPADLRLTRINS